jgi:hypothetical protein
MQGNRSREAANLGAFRDSNLWYNVEADFASTVFRNEEADFCISSSDSGDNNMDGGAPYEAMLAGRQLLNWDGFPTQSRQVMSPDLAMISCKSRPSAFCLFSP